MLEVDSMPAFKHAGFILSCTTLQHDQYFATFVARVICLELVSGVFSVTHLVERPMKIKFLNVYLNTGVCC